MYISAYSQDQHRALVVSCTCKEYSYPCSEKATMHSVDEFLWFLKCSCYFHICLTNLLFIYRHMPYSCLTHKFKINLLYITLAFFRSKGISFFFLIRNFRSTAVLFHSTFVFCILNGILDNSSGSVNEF